MLDPQTSDMRQIRHMMSTFPLASARLSKLLIPFVNDLLDGDLCKNLFYFLTFSCFSGLKHAFIICVILPVSHFQTQ